MSVQKSSERLGWDGLRTFRALAARGTLTGAARALGVQHTTVARQIDALERELGARLFLRNARGYTLTRVGESLRESVENIGHEVDRVALLARGQNLAMAGAVRIATADALATHVLVPALPRLLRQHPALSVEIVSDTRQHDLSRREADAALRLGPSRDDRLVGRRLASVGFALYRSRQARAPRRAELRRAPYATFDESVGPLPHDEWLATHAPQARLVLRANRQHTLVEAARRGLALAILPCLVGDGDPGLARVLGPDEVFSRELWLLVHPDLQHSARVRALLDAVAAHVTHEAERMAGQGLTPGAPSR